MSPDTDSVPTVDVAPAAEGAAELRADAPRAGWWRRLADSVAHPVLRILVISTLVGRVGRGVFLTVTVLYFSLIVGLSPAEVAIVLAANSAVGVVSSALAGHLADRFSAKRMLIACMTLESVGLACYTFATSFPVALVLACLVGVVDSSGNTMRSAIVARAFTGPERVNARAVMRTVTNIAIAVGSAFGGVALALGSAEAYRAVMLGAAAVLLASVGVLVRLPASVDAVPRVEQRTATGSILTVSRWAHSPWRDGRYLLVTALSAIFAMQFGLAEVGVPLWLVHETTAPEATLSALLILNTIIVIIFQVPASRGTHDLRKAGTVTAWAGVLMAAACVLYFSASLGGVVIAISMLVTAAVAHAFAEVYSQAGAWGLSFELADAEAPGAYQGVFGMGFNLGMMLAPIVVTAAVSLGLAGWLILGAVFLASAFGTTAVAWRAARTTGTRAAAA